jgi:Escherichia/Staphylococcus phage prohead protease
VNLILRIEIRGDSMVIDGYVNAVDRWSRVLPSQNKGRFREKIIPKAFDKALRKGNNVLLLLNHDKSKVLGSLEERNVELYEDNIGLRCIATVTDPETIELGRSGKLKGWSFGFYSNKDSYIDGADGIQERSVEDLDLVEISVLSNVPAYIGTSLEMRGEEEVVAEMRSMDSAAITEDLTPPKKIDFDYSKYEQTIKSLKEKGSKK